MTHSLSLSLFNLSSASNLRASLGFEKTLKGKAFVQDEVGSNFLLLEDTVLQDNSSNI